MIVNINQPNVQPYFTYVNNNLTKDNDTVTHNDVDNETTLIMKIIMTYTIIYYYRKVLCSAVYIVYALQSGSY